MYDVTLPPAVGPLLSAASHIHPSSFNPTSSALVFLLFAFPPFFFRLAVLSSFSPLSLCQIPFLGLLFTVNRGSFFSSPVSKTSSFCFMLHPADFLHVHISKESSLFISSYPMVQSVTLHSTTFHLSVFNHPAEFSSG